MTKKTTKKRKTTKKFGSTRKLISNSKFVLFVLAFAVIGAAYVFFTRAATTGGSVTVTPTADTYVSSSNKQSHATIKYVRAASSAGGVSRKAYFKFDLSVPADGTVTSAKLRLYVSGSSDKGGDLYKTDVSTWSEKIIYGQEPALSGAALASLGAVKSNTWVDFNLPVASISGTGTYSFALISASTDTVEYSTRETTQKPQFIVNYTIPDTTSPSVPSGLKSSNVTQTGAKIDWTASTDDRGGTVSYEILRNNTVISTTTTNSYSDTGLSASTAYVYTVRAKDASGNTSAASSALSVTTAGGTTTTTPPPSDTPSGYTLLWSDEFNGTSLDATKWNVYSGTLDYDQACYRPSNVTVGGGNLVIRTKSETGQCASATSKWTGTSTARPYTSGYIRSDAVSGAGDKYTVSPSSVTSKVIRIEFRSQMPVNLKGLWPGLWSRNTQSGTYYGELDLIERFGDPRNAYSFNITTHIGTRHTGGDTGSVSNWTCPSTAVRNNCDTNVETGMQSYAVEVDVPKAELRYYLNDRMLVQHKSTTSPVFDSATWARVLNDPWDLRIMTQVVDPNDPYHPEPDASFATSDLKVDYVRVYSKN